MSYAEHHEDCLGELYRQWTLSEIRRLLKERQEFLKDKKLVKGVWVKD